MLELILLAMLLFGPSTSTAPQPVQAPSRAAALDQPWTGPSDVLAASVNFCDGADLDACPCENPGLLDAGCDNAQATGGVALSVLAQTTSPNKGTIAGTGFPPVGSPASVLIRSPGLDPFSPVVFGDGLRCVGTIGLVNMGATTASLGTAFHTFGHSAMIGPGTFYYQIWYRNTPQTFCDAAAPFNLSNGVTMDW